MPADEASYAANAPLTQQALMAFQNLRAPLTVLLGLGLRMSVGDDKSYRGDLDAMLRGGMDALTAANPFALAWSQALPNVVNMVGGRSGDDKGLGFGCWFWVLVLGVRCGVFRFGFGFCCGF